MRLIVTAAALLALCNREAVARQAAGYGVAGIGTTADGSGYNVHVNWVYPGNQTSTHVCASWSVIVHAPLA